MFANVRKSNLISLILLTTLTSVPVMAQTNQNAQTAAGVPILWRDPGDVAKRDLRYGPGSAELAPQAPFTFAGEESTGESPKFKVTDGHRPVESPGSCQFYG